MSPRFPRGLPFLKPPAPALGHGGITYFAPALGPGDTPPYTSHVMAVCIPTVQMRKLRLGAIRLVRQSNWMHHFEGTGGRARDRETEAQRGEVTGSGSHSSQPLEPKLEARSSGTWPGCEENKVNHIVFSKQVPGLPRWPPNTLKAVDTPAHPSCLPLAIFSGKGSSGTSQTCPLS